MNYQKDVGLNPKRKYSPDYDQPAKYWGATSVWCGKPFEREDGSIAVDKTMGFHSRPKKKQELRQANRSLKKAARRKLQRDLKNVIEEI